MSENKEKKRTSYAVPLGIMYIVVVIFFVLQPAYVEYQRAVNAMEELKQCRANIEEIRRAVEVYCHRHEGNAPASLSDLQFVGGKPLPACPAAQALKRGNSYEGKGYEYLQKTSHRPVLFTVRCWGNNHYHLNIPKHQPFYSSRKGLHPSDYEIDKYNKP